MGHFVGSSLVEAHNRFPISVLYLRFGALEQARVTLEGKYNTSWYLVGNFKNAYDKLKWFWIITNQIIMKKYVLALLSTLHLLTAVKCSGSWFNIRMTSYQYRKSHCGDKTIFRPSYLHNGISYTGKITSLYWIRAQASTGTPMTRSGYRFVLCRNFKVWNNSFGPRRFKWNFRWLIFKPILAIDSHPW